MVTYEQRAIHIKLNDGKQASGEVRVALYDTRSRFLRALKLLGLFWLIAVGIFVTFIPGFHLLGSITLLLLGPFFAWKRYNTTTIIEKGDGQCPSCAQPITLRFETTDQLPMWTYCPKCNGPLQLLPDTTTPG